MATRRRQQQFQEEGQDSQSSSNAESSSSMRSRGPATQHPLFPSTSPSKPSFTSYHNARLQQKSKSSNDSEYIVNHDIPRGKTSFERAQKQTTLDKLEGWLGINADVPPPPRSAASAPPRANSTPRKQSTQLVLVHEVNSKDTIDALAIRYNTDARTLRRVNGLWPTDSVQARKEIYVPIDEDAAALIAQRESSQSVLQASQDTNGKLSLLDSLPRHDRAISSASTASSSSGNGATSSYGQPANMSPELRRIPIQALSHFPPRGSELLKGKGKDSPAMELDQGLLLDPGESGVDDLLQLAQRARQRGETDPSSSNASLVPPPPSSLIGSTRPSMEIASQDGRESRTSASSPALSSRALDEDWKPNRYTLGRRKGSTLLRQDSNSGVNSESSTRTAAPPSDTKLTNRDTQSYQGWNDIPEPPLNRTAKGQVAHAYKAKRRYPRATDGTGGVQIPGTALIEDLAAGLPPNSGRAANWARPIGDSLPVQQSNENHRVTSPGWSQIFSDTVRGKIRLEEAFERGIEDIRAGLSQSGTLKPPPNGTSRRSNAPAQRPSAEMARAALADPPPPTISSQNGHQNLPPSDQLLGLSIDGSAGSDKLLHANAANPGAIRRSSGRSIHELEDLRVQQERGSTPDHLRKGERRTTRNVDWIR